MAQRLSIPIEFASEIERSYWVVGIARPIKWYLGYGGWEVEVRIQAPKHLAGMAQNLPPEEIPPDICALLPPEGERFTKEARNAEIEVLIGTYRGEPRQHKVNAWDVRQDFLALDGSTSSLLDFLNRYGTWHRGYAPRLNTSGDELAWDPVIVGPLGIWRDRAQLRADLIAGASAWFRSPRSHLDFHTRAEFPHFVHQDHFCEDAVKTSITVDFLRKVRFRVCPRVDCGVPFSADRKGKIYCSQYCAHLVSLRKTRKKQQALRRKDG